MYGCILTHIHGGKGEVTEVSAEQEKSNNPVPATVCPISVRSYLHTVWLPHTLSMASLR